MSKVTAFVLLGLGVVFALPGLAMLWLMIGGGTNLVVVAPGFAWLAFAVPMAGLVGCGLIAWSAAKLIRR